MNNKPVAGIGRREFLQVSAVAAAGAVVLGPEVLASELASPPKRLAVGFVRHAMASTKEHLDVISAHEIFGTDGAFLSLGARVSLVSTAGAQGSQPDARRVIELNVQYPYFDGAARHDAPFYAWTFDRSTSGVGQQTSFVVPVDDIQQSINFTVGTQIAQSQPSSRRRSAGPSSSGSTAQREATPFTLSIRREPGSYPLARGYYVLVPLADGEREPNWSSLSLVSFEGRWRLTPHNRWNQAPIEHLVLRVNYAE